MNLWSMCPEGTRHFVSRVSQHRLLNRRLGRYLCRGMEEYLEWMKKQNADQKVPGRHGYTSQLSVGLQILQLLIEKEVKQSSCTWASCGRVSS